MHLKSKFTKNLIILLFTGLISLIFIYLYWFLSISPVTEKVETKDGIFTLGPPLERKRTESGGTAIGNNFYILGGINSLAQTLNDFHVFNREKNEWNRLPDVPYYVNHPGVVTDGEYVYVVGGIKPLGIRIRGFMFAKWDPYNILIRYHPQTESWEELASMPEARGAGGVCYGEGKIWYVGGINSQREISNSLFEYDIESNMWTERAPMKYARDHMRMEYYKGNLYAISGREDDLRFNLDHLEKYNIESESWSLLQPIPTPRGGFSSVVFDDKIFTFGGENVWSCYSEIEVFDLIEEKWMQHESLPEGRHGIVGGVINNEIHLISGGKHPRVSVSGLHRIYSPKQ
ncbi:Kelch repeat-containing protein [Ekhidna lutea]|nr:kelch repeat-containing protein [Ekhidna lutea]